LRERIRRSEIEKSMRDQSLDLTKAREVSLDYGGEPGLHKSYRFDGHLMLIKGERTDYEFPK
jgi:hypothetical protein